MLALFYTGRDLRKIPTYLRTSSQSCDTFRFIFSLVVLFRCQADFVIEKIFRIFDPCLRGHIKFTDILTGQFNSAHKAFTMFINVFVISNKLFYAVIQKINLYTFLFQFSRCRCGEQVRVKNVTGKGKG